MSKRILHMTLHRKWFDLIASGEKCHEYREAKPYWEKRLFDPETGAAKEYDEIHFRNGYAKDSPFMRVEFVEASFTGAQWWEPACGEELWPETIVIHLGKVLEVRR
jgi:hypothetical protein